MQRAEKLAAIDRELEALQSELMRLEPLLPSLPSFRKTTPSHVDAGSGFLGNVLEPILEAKNVKNTMHHWLESSVSGLLKNPLSTRPDNAWVFTLAGKKVCVFLLGKPLKVAVGTYTTTIDEKAICAHPVLVDSNPQIAQDVVRGLIERA